MAHDSHMIFQFKLTKESIKVILAAFIYTMSDQVDRLRSSRITFSIGVPNVLFLSEFKIVFKSKFLIFDLRIDKFRRPERKRWKLGLIHVYFINWCNHYGQFLCMPPKQPFEPLMIDADGQTSAFNGCRHCPARRKPEICRLHAACSACISSGNFRFWGTTRTRHESCHVNARAIFRATCTACSN